MRLRFDPHFLSEQLDLSREACTPELGALYIDAVTTMSRGPQFRGYPFKGDLRGDALLALQRAARSFNRDRCKDPNGWLATIIRNSFKRTIKREKALYATTLRLAVDAGAEIGPTQLEWLRAHEAG